MPDKPPRPAISRCPCSLLHTGFVPTEHSGWAWLPCIKAGFKTTPLPRSAQTHRQCHKHPSHSTDSTQCNPTSADLNTDPNHCNSDGQPQQLMFRPHASAHPHRAQQAQGVPTPNSTHVCKSTHMHCCHSLPRAQPQGYTFHNVVCSQAPKRGRPHAHMPLNSVAVTHVTAKVVLCYTATVHMWCATDAKPAAGLSTKPVHMHHDQRQLQFKDVPPMPLPHLAARLQG